MHRGARARLSDLVRFLLALLPYNPMISFTGDFFTGKFKVSSSHLGDILNKNINLARIFFAEMGRTHFVHVFTKFYSRRDSAQSKQGMENLKYVDVSKHYEHMTLEDYNGNGFATLIILSIIIHQYFLFYSSFSSHVFFTRVM